MSNTTIQLRHSTETGNVPVSLANGEIAINTQDGKLFYADPTGTVQEFSGFPGPSGLDTEIQFNDSGVLGANSRLTFNKTTGTLTVNGTVVANVFSDDGTNLLVFANNAYTHANAAFEAANSGGGGSITVTVDTIPPASGNTIGDIWIDTDTGKEFRWIDDGDSYQWVEFGGAGITGADGDQAFADLAFDHANASFDAANTNSTTISFAYNHANAAFDSANTINPEDTYARDQANASFIQANAAFDAANTKASTSKAFTMSILFG